MPDLILELLSEEIPARMQRAAAENLKKLVSDGLAAAGLDHDGARAFATPRRLALAISGLPARSPDITEERKGPRVGAPEKAIAGFLGAAGLSSLDQARRVADPKKGDYYVAVTTRPGRAASEIIAEVVCDSIRRFPWPKSMRWGAGSLRWVRPLRSIMCTFGPETEEPEVVEFEIAGIRSGNVTRGHRFLDPEPISIRRFEDYAAKLEKAHVVLDGERRADIILHDIKDLALAQGLELVEDRALIEETAGLVEWPVVLMGRFDKAFLAVPEEVIVTSIRTHQKCFALKDPRTGRLANRFAMVSNMPARDHGKAIIAGNERVVRARLSDARFFWESDLKRPLRENVEKLDRIVFHEKLGSQGERVARLERLAGEIAPLVGAGAHEARRAAHLAKADLVSEMVGEFPELQGVMGRRYAEAQGEDAAIAAAIEDHYRPQGPGDAVPGAPITIAVALADKLDLLAGFWAIGEKPTGSKDPFALRRATLGIIRIVLENGLRLGLRPLALFALRQNLVAMLRERGEEMITQLPLLDRARRQGLLRDVGEYLSRAGEAVLEQFGESWEMPWESGELDDLLSFFADRLKVQLRQEGARHDLVDAVFALPDQDDLLMIVRRIAALARFLDSEDGANLLAGYRRAANILKAEEKKDGSDAFGGDVDRALLRESEEILLARALDAAEADARAAVAREDFEAAMTALAGLRAPVDAFFDAVLVNAEEPEIRANRLKLLSRIRAATLTVADFSHIGG